MNRLVRIPMLILAAVQAMLAGLTALTGAFANGGEWWERVPLILIHPVAAVALVILVVLPQPSRRFVIATAILLLVNVVTDVLLSVAILSGITRGDWWLPLMFSVIPLIALPYCRVLLHSQ